MTNGQEKVREIPGQYKVRVFRERQETSRFSKMSRNSLFQTNSQGKVREASKVDLILNYFFSIVQRIHCKSLVNISLKTKSYSRAIFYKSNFMIMLDFGQEILV